MAEYDPAHADEPAEPERSKVFAARLDYLFKNVHPRDRGPYTNAEVARAIGVSETYIGYLRSGARDNPTLMQMQALADFWDVPLASFVDGGEGDRVRDDLQLLKAFKDVGAKQIALRTVAELSDDNVNTVLPVLRRLKETQETQRTRGRRMRPRKSATDDPKST